MDGQYPDMCKYQAMIYLNLICYFCKAFILAFIVMIILNYHDNAFKQHKTGYPGRIGKAI